MGLLPPAPHFVCMHPPAIRSEMTLIKTRCLKELSSIIEKHSYEVVAVLVVDRYHFPFMPFGKHIFRDEKMCPCIALPSNYDQLVLQHSILQRALGKNHPDSFHAPKIEVVDYIGTCLLSFSPKCKTHFQAFSMSHCWFTRTVRAALWQSSLMSPQRSSSIVIFLFGKRERRITALDKTHIEVQ